MKYRFILLFLLSTYVVFGQQFKNNRILHTIKVDSVMVSTVHFQDKTTELPLAENFHPSTKDSINSEQSLPFHDENKTKDTIYLLKSKKLTLNEILVLNKIFSSSKSYVKDTPLIWHYDIQFDYFKNDSIIQTITISSYTKKIVIKKKGCKTYLDNDGQEIDPCFFMGKISKKTKTYIVRLLKNKKLWRKEQFFFEDL
jgi:hypothetical protein